MASSLDLIQTAARSSAVATAASGRLGASAAKSFAKSFNVSSTQSNGVTGNASETQNSPRSFSSQLDKRVERQAQDSRTEDRPRPQERKPSADATQTKSVQPKPAQTKPAKPTSNKTDETDPTAEVADTTQTDQTTDSTTEAKTQGPRKTGSKSNRPGEAKKADSDVDASGDVSETDNTDETINLDATAALPVTTDETLEDVAVDRNADETDKSADPTDPTAATTNALSIDLNVQQAILVKSTENTGDFGAISGVAPKAEGSADKDSQNVKSLIEALSNATPKSADQTEGVPGKAESKTVPSQTQSTGESFGAKLSHAAQSRGLGSTHLESSDDAESGLDTSGGAGSSGLNGEKTSTQGKFDISNFEQLSALQAGAFDDAGSMSTLSGVEAGSSADSATLQQTASQLASQVAGSTTHVVQGSHNSPLVQANAQVSYTTESRFAQANVGNIVSSVHGELLPQGGTMTLRLDPPEVGALQVAVTMKNGLASVSFQTDNPEAARLMTHSLSDLRDSLQAAGVTVDNISVQQAPKSESGSNNSGNSAGQGEGRQSSQPYQQDDNTRRDQQRKELLEKMWRRVTGDDVNLIA